jgi:hypothetical protein
MSVLVCTLPGPELSDPVHNSESIIAVADRYAARLKSEIRKELRGLWGTLERRSTCEQALGSIRGLRKIATATGKWVGASRRNEGRSGCDGRAAAAWIYPRGSGAMTEFRYQS